MSAFRGFTLVLLLIALSARKLDGAVTNISPTIVEFGTYTQALAMCDQQKIFLGQASPATITIPAAAAAATNIAYILVDGSAATYPTGGITAAITSGTVGAATRIGLKVTSGTNKAVFLGDVTISSFC